jgi:hypothetical protein
MTLLKKFEKKAAAENYAKGQRRKLWQHGVDVKVKKTKSGYSAVAVRGGVKKPRRRSGGGYGNLFDLAF